MSFGWLIAAAWATLVGYWCVSGVAAVRSTGSRWIWWREITLRLGFFAAVVLELQINVQNTAIPCIFNSNPLLGPVGFLLTATGVGLAIGARVSLGSGWAAPATNLEPRELITTGVYAFVRHPLYGGLLLAMLGSAIGQSVLWMLPLIVYWPGFVLSARREEHFLTEQFSDRYRQYMSRTRMFVPFVF